MAHSQKQARTFRYMGNHLKIHAGAADTSGQYAMIEFIQKPGTEPPLHYHENEDELFLVLAGEMAVTRGDAEIILRAGDSAMVPRRVPHTFRLRTPVVRSIAVFTPAGFEGFFRTIGEPAEEDVWPPRASATPLFDRIAEVAGRFGSRIVA